ncbi:MAG: MarR family winged helix-turn-helix transcriptional regulator [Lachnospiraceae bacterium]
MSKRIDNTVCHCLKMRRSAENVIHFYDNILAPSGVTVRQYSLLRAISEHSGCNVRVLSEATLLERSTLARSLKPLIQYGYIKDKKTEGARDSVLELSENGVSVCNEAASLWETAQSQLEEKLGKEQLKALENVLTLLQNL